MEICLLYLAVGERDLLRHLAHAVDHTAKAHALGRSRIDDLAAYIAGRPDMVHFDLVVLVDRHIRNLGKITQVTEIAGDAQSPPRLLLAIGPVGLLGYQLQNS